MIREHDEISEEDQDEEEDQDVCNEDGDPRNPQRMSPYHKQVNSRPYEIQQEHQPYPAGDGRPTNRLGCSRAFHQMNSTKGGGGDPWKDASFPR